MKRKPIVVMSIASALASLTGATGRGCLRLRIGWRRIEQWGVPWRDHSTGLLSPYREGLPSLQRRAYITVHSHGAHNGGTSGN